MQQETSVGAEFSTGVAPADNFNQQKLETSVPVAATYIIKGCNAIFDRRHSDDERP
jgi:hypothetical protein